MLVSASASGHQISAVRSTVSPAIAFSTVSDPAAPSRAGRTFGYRPAATVVSSPTTNSDEAANARPHSPRR